MNELASNEMLFVQCILADPSSEVTIKALEWVKPEMVVSSVCRDIVLAAKELIQDGCPVTKDFLLARFPWDEARKEYITNLDAEKVAGCDIRKVSKALLEGVNQRKILDVLREAVETSRNPGFKPKDLVETLSRQLADMSSGMNGEQLKVISVADSMDKSAHGEALTPLDHSENVVTLGIPDLDEVVRMTRRSYGVVAAVTSAGKSTLAIQMATKSAMKGKRTLMVSLEMDHDEVHAKAIACMKQEKVWDIQTGRHPMFFSQEEREAGSRIETLCCGSGQAWNPIESIIRSKHKASPLDIVIIDYLTLFEAPDHTKSANLAQRFGELSKSVRRLSQELKVAMVVVCQFNREAEEGTEPMLKQLRESGQIENDCNWAILLWNPDKAKANGSDQRVVNFKIAKNRGGRRGDTGTILFEPAMSLFVPAMRSK